MALLLALGGTAVADGSTSRLKLPEPKVFLTPDTVSLFVVQAKPEDEAFRDLFNTAWEALSGPRGAGRNWIYRVILSKIQGEDTNTLGSLLPAQYVRIDSMDDNAEQPSPTTATTVSGWPTRAVSSRSPMIRSTGTKFDLVSGLLVPAPRAPVSDAITMLSTL